MGPLRNTHKVGHIQSGIHIKWDAHRFACSRSGRNEIYRECDSYGVGYTWNGTLHGVGHIFELGSYTEWDTRRRTHTRSGKYGVGHTHELGNTERDRHEVGKTEWDTQGVGNIRGGTHTGWVTYR